MQHAVHKFRQMPAATIGMAYTSPMKSMSTAEKVGEQVHVLMRRRGMTQRQLGALLGLAQPSVSDRIAGRVVFDIEELDKVADALEVPLSSLLPSKASA